MIQFSVHKQTPDCGALILPLFEGENLQKQIQHFDEQLLQNAGLLTAVRDFEAKPRQLNLVYTKDENLPRVVLLGLGKQEDFSIRNWKRALGTTVLWLQSKKVTTLACVVPEIFLEHFSPKQLAHVSVVAVEVSGYAFDRYKQVEQQVSKVESFGFVCESLGSKKKSFLQGIASGQTVATSIQLVRDLGNTPPSVMTPTFLATTAQDLAKKYEHLNVKVLSRPQIEKLNMGCFLGVASGSQEEPKFIIVEYFAGKKSEAPTVLVGKGITFDSGGLSLKPGDYMVDMKFDMLGAATVLGTIVAAAALGLKRNIVALLPSCENMPSGTAYRPDDILIAMNGKSVLVENTDAEGRLILADALCYASRYKPKEVIDLATLTGACMVALGNERSGLFSKQEHLVEGLQQSATSVGEELWHLPLGEEYSEAMKSEIADIKNLGGVGGSRYAGASTAAAFLEFFTDYPWAHIDLSCSSYGGKGKAWIRPGANGFGVETLIAYLQS